MSMKVCESDIKVNPQIIEEVGRLFAKTRDPMLQEKEKKVAFDALKQLQIKENINVCLPPQDCCYNLPFGSVFLKGKDFNDPKTQEKVQLLLKNGVVPNVLIKQLPTGKIEIEIHKPKSITYLNTVWL